MDLVDILLVSTLVTPHKVTSPMAIRRRATLHHLVPILSKDTLHRGIIPHKGTLQLRILLLTPKGMDLMEDQC